MASRARPKPLRDPEVVLRASKEPAFHQERSRRSYLALLEAAEQLFATQKYDDVGTPEIAQRAGVSVGTFYRYFDDKQEVYLEIARRSFSAAYAQTLEGLTPAQFVGLTRHETIAHSVDVLFGYVLARPSLTRSFNEMALRDAAVAEVRRAFEQVSIERLAALITAIVSRDVVPDAQATAFVLYGSAMHCAYAAAEHFGEPHVSHERSKAALVAFIESALFPN